MSEYFLGCLSGILLVFLHIVIVAVVIRKKNFIAPVVVHAFSGALMLGMLCILFLYVSNFDFWVAFCILAFGISSYLFVFGALYKSLSLSFLLETKRNNDEISLVQLNKSITEKSFSDRVKILCDMGLVFKDADNYKITEKGLKFVKILNSIKNFFRIDTLGLYKERN